MSWWTKFRDKAEKVATYGLYDPKASRQAEAEQRYMISDQIKAYKDQTELTKNELNNTRNEIDAEKRRVQEKQIRSLRRNYRAPSSGMLGVGQQSSQDMNTKLGG